MYHTSHQHSFMSFHVSLNFPFVFYDNAIEIDVSKCHDLTHCVLLIVQLRSLPHPHATLELPSQVMLGLVGALHQRFHSWLATDSR